MEPNPWGRPLRDRAELLKTLSLVLDLLDPGTTGFEYRLVGTGAALAQGVHLPTGDIDILVARREEVDRFAAALAGFPCLEPPEWLPQARQYFTHFEIDGIDVGASTVEVPTNAKAIECIGSGPWQHYVSITTAQHTVPAVALELRLVSELIRNRPDRYTPLIEHMRSNGADIELVQQSMREREVDPARQRQILNRLQDQPTPGEGVQPDLRPPTRSGRLPGG
jgi:hypothetical protein